MSQPRKPEPAHSKHLPQLFHRSRAEDITPSPPKRFPPPQRQDSVQSRYVTMLLGLDDIPRLHNILISFFSWLLLAGFMIFPGTFTTIQHLDTSNDPAAATTIIQGVQHIPLLYIASACAIIGALGMIWLWYLHRMNYVWLLNRIFLPGCLNSLAGLITTLVNVYAQQHGVWSVVAKVTAIVTGSCAGVTGFLFALYNFWVLAGVKKQHGRDMEGFSARGDEHEGEGLVEKMQRKAKEPALEPGSVV